MTAAGTPIDPAVPLFPGAAPADHCVDAMRKVLRSPFEQIQRYTSWANDQWEMVKQWDRKQKAPDTLDRQQFFDVRYHEGDTPGSDVQTRQSYAEELFSGFDVEGLRKSIHALLDTASSNTTSPSAKRSLATEIEMHFRLGQWLCSYFLGMPLVNVWEEIALKARSIGAFPGGAFYNKMAGDVYREQIRRTLDSVDGKVGVIYVMAYTPLLMIPDEEDLSYVSMPVRNHEALGQCAADILRLMECVEKLACRYLRFQVWKFFTAPKAPRLLYAVSEMSVVAAIRDLTVMRYLQNQRQQPASGAEMGLDDLRQRWPTLSEAERQAFWSSHRRELGSIEKQIHNESDARLRYFLGPNQANCTLGVFSEMATRRRGLTSCVVGDSGGVVANRPNRSDEVTAFCTWVDGIVLDEERGKLETLWAKHEAGGEHLVHLYNPASTASYSERWCKIALLSTLLKREPEGTETAPAHTPQDREIRKA